MKPKEIWDTPINAPAETYAEFFYGMAPEPELEEELMEEVSEEETHSLLSASYRYNGDDTPVLPGPQELKLLPGGKGEKG